MRKDRNYRSRQVYCWHFARPLPICAVYISQKKKMGSHRSDCGSLLCDAGGIAIEGGGTRSSAETKRFGIKRKKNKQKQSKIRSIHYRRRSSNTRALSALCAQHLDDPFFSQVRTRQLPLFVIYTRPIQRKLKSRVLLLFDRPHI